MTSQDCEEDAFYVALVCGLHICSKIRHNVWERKMS